MLSLYSRRSCPLLTAAVCLLVLATGSNAWSQETVYIGGPAPRGSVQVDMSVLDDLGRAGQNALPDRAAAGQQVTLTPPSQKKATAHKTTTKAKAVTARKPPAPTTKAAAPTATVKADVPAPQLAASTPSPASQAAPQSTAPRAATAPSDLPPPPPAPIEITMPPPAPAPVAPKAVAAVATAAAVAPVAAKTSETPVPMTAVKEPAASPAPARPAEITAAPEANSMSASAAVVMPAAATIAAAPQPAVSPTPKTASAPQVTAAAPEPAPAAKPQSAPAQTASLTPTPDATTKQSMRIAFAGDAATLPEPSKPDLKNIAGSLSKDAALRVQVMAYASGSDDASKARRVSLSRALAVRSYLIEQGVGSTRIDVRALGSATEGGPADRVDLMVLSR